MSFLCQSWFWRGAQSAFYYYASCTPCVDYKYREKRRREAAKAGERRAKIITTQPGIVHQPVAFETNEAWAEEILAGPGPPPGWKGDKLLQKFKKEDNVKQPTYARRQIIPTSRPPAIEDNEIDTSYEANHAFQSEKRHPQKVSDHQTHGGGTSDGSIQRLQPPKNRVSMDKSQPGRPRAERRISSTIDTIKDTLRSSIHPERWNSKRYEREDEVLRGFSNFRGNIHKMWDRATGQTPSNENATSSPHPVPPRRRATSNESERYEWQLARNPEINELHPPVVSQLPRTREDAAWMLLPPPSAAVMEGKVPPNVDKSLRWPLAKIGSTKDQMAYEGQSRLIRKSQRPPSLSFSAERSSVEAEPETPLSPNEGAPEALPKAGSASPGRSSEHFGGIYSASH